MMRRTIKLGDAEVITNTYDVRESIPQKGVLLHRRLWLYLYPEGTEHDTHHQAHAEVLLQKPKLDFAARFHVGNYASETPFDGHLRLFGSTIYWGLGIGRKLAHRITSRGDHKYGSRDIAFHTGEGSGRIYWSFWEQEDAYRGRKPKWQYGSFSLNILDRIYGRKTYSYTTLHTAEFEVDFLEDSYPVVVEYQLQVLKRERQERIIEQSYVLGVEAHNGIPTHYDPSGGWKGDRTYGFGVKAPAFREDWEKDAKMAIEAWVLEERARTGFRKAQDDD